MTTATRGRTSSRETWGALAAWAGSRLAVVLVTLAGAYQLRGSRQLLDGWDSWDATQLREIAQYGYGGYPLHYADRDVVAFFPGFPAVMAAVHVLVPDWIVAGLLVSAVAGVVATVALARLASLDGVDGGRAVLYLVLSPFAVFLAAGYSESLFLALALPGWLCARRGRWAEAAVLVSLASLVRVNGLFLAVALLVLWWTSSRSRQDLVWLGLPFVAAFGYVAYLHQLTGDWNAWQHAQTEGWGRHLTAPWTALQHTWQLVTDQGAGLEYRWEYGWEIAAVAVGLLVVAVLVRERQWGEATYVALSVAALATSTYYLSISRATLLWFPLWVLLARAAARRPWLHTGYVAVSTPLMVVGVLTFTAGRWTG